LVLFDNFCVSDSLRIGPGSSGADVIKRSGFMGLFAAISMTISFKPVFMGA